MAEPMWVLLMYDLPVKTKNQRRDATRYRNGLKDLGFSQIQLSVYAKYLINASGLRVIMTPIRNSIPTSGEIRVIRLTDEQWAHTYRFHGPEQVDQEPKPGQLALFTD